MDHCRTCRRPSRNLSWEFLALVKRSWADREIVVLYQISQSAMLPRTGGR